MSCLECLTYYFTFLSIYSFVNVVAYSPTIHVALFLFSSPFLCEHCYLIYQLCGLRYFAFLLCYVVDVATYSPTMWVTLLYFSFLFYSFVNIIPYHQLRWVTWLILLFSLLFLFLCEPKYPIHQLCVCVFYFFKKLFSTPLWMLLPSIQDLGHEALMVFTNKVTFCDGWCHEFLASLWLIGRRWMLMKMIT